MSARRTPPGRALAEPGDLRARCRRGVLSRPAVLAALATLLAPMAPGTAHAQDCAAAAGACEENPRFSVALTDFRVIQGSSAHRPLAATLRLRNKTDAPLTLVYVDGSATVIDDQGHRYTMQSTRQGLRGLGLATRREFDPRFTLGPGETGDARLEVTAFIKGIRGTRFDLAFALREVEALPGGQQRLGRETLLRFAGLQDGAGAAAPAAAAPGAAAAVGAVGAAPAAAGGDACQGQPQCVASGPLVARLERLAPEAVKANHQGVVATVAFHNVSDRPLTLTYRADSGAMLDELGQRYTVDSRRKTDVQGMPVSTRERASSQFTLAPGEVRRAQFRYTRFVGHSRPGTRFTPTLAIEQYELLPSQQLRLVREHALDFGAVAGGAGAGLQPAVDLLEQLLKKR